MSPLRAEPCAVGHTVAKTRNPEAGKMGRGQRRSRDGPVLRDSWLPGGGSTDRGLGSKEHWTRSQKSFSPPVSEGGHLSSLVTS